MTKYIYLNQDTRSEHTNDNPNNKNTSAQSRERYAMDGFTPPAGIVGVEAVKEMQRWLGGLTVDGIWGPKTQKQFDKAMAAVLKTAEVPPAPADRERLGYAEDIYKLSLGIGKSDRGNYMVRGYDPPGNIKGAEDVRAFQAEHGLDVDGIWASRTQQRFDQIQQQWAGQYDPEEIAWLVVEGLHKLAGAGGGAFLEGSIPLSSGSAKAGQAEGGTTAQIMGVQAGAKPATLSYSTMPNRAAKGYTIPQGVSDVAATQRMLGVGVDGLWGEETDRAYKKLMSGGNVRSSAQAVAAQLKQLYQDVAASNLSMGEKAEAIALLAALEQYGDPEYQRKTLLGIQMKGGAAAFFKQPSGPSLNAMIDTQKKLYYSLQDKLEQNRDEINKFFMGWLFPSEDYKELQRQKIELEQQIGAVEKRLDQFAPKWDEIIDIWDWSEVDAWEQGQLAEAAKVAEEKAKAEAEAKAAAEAKVEEEISDENDKQDMPVINSSIPITVTKEQLSKIGWENVNDELVLDLLDAMERCEINTPMRLLFFLTMITHEGGYNRGNITESNEKKYTKPSIEGGKYRGAGYIQLTGRDNYEAFSKHMHDPEIFEKGADYVAEFYPWESVIWFWNYRRVNKFIDEVGTLDAATERIKGKGEVASPGRWESFNKVYAALFGENS